MQTSNRHAVHRQRSCPAGHRPSANPCSRGPNSPPRRAGWLDNPWMSRQPVPTDAPARRSPPHPAPTDRVPTRRSVRFGARNAACLEPTMDKTRALVPLLACLLAAGRCVAADAPSMPTAPLESRVGSAAGDVPRRRRARRAGRRTPAVRGALVAERAPADGGYRLSLSRGSLDLGLHFESRLVAPRGIDARFDSAAPPGATLPAIVDRAAQRQRRPDRGEQPRRARTRIERVGTVREQGRDRMEAGAVAGLLPPRARLSPQRRRPADHAAAQGLVRRLHGSQRSSAAAGAASGTRPPCVSAASAWRCSCWSGR